MLGGWAFTVKIGGCNLLDKTAASAVLPYRTVFRQPTSVRCETPLAPPRPVFGRLLPTWFVQATRRENVEVSREIRAAGTAHGRHRGDVLCSPDRGKRTLLGAFVFTSRSYQGLAQQPGSPGLHGKNLPARHWSCD